MDKELLSREVLEGLLWATLSGTVAQRFLALGALAPSFWRLHCFSHLCAKISGKNLNTQKNCSSELFWVSNRALIYASACWNFPVEYSCRQKVQEVCVCGSRDGKVHFRKPGPQLWCDKGENKGMSGFRTHHKHIESVSQSAFPNLPNYLYLK